MSAFFPLTYLLFLLFHKTKFGENSLFKIYLFLIEGELLYRIVLVYGKHQHESAIGIPIPPPLGASLPIAPL